MSAKVFRKILISMLAWNSWVEGYVSGVEDYASIAQNVDVTTNTDGNGMIGWMSNYCSSNPEKEIRSAASMMLSEFTKNGTITFTKKP